MWDSYTDSAILWLADDYNSGYISLSFSVVTGAVRCGQLLILGLFAMHVSHHGPYSWTYVPVSLKIMTLVSTGGVYCAKLLGYVSNFTGVGSVGLRSTDNATCVIMLRAAPSFGVRYTAKWVQCTTIRMTWTRKWVPYTVMYHKYVGC